MTTLLFADHNSYLFEQGNKLYEQGKYLEAIQKYEEIIGNGYESWELYYNLGNAFYKNKQLGKAILNYERAKILASKNEDILYNLELANLSVVDKIISPPEFFIFSIFSDFKNYFSLNVLSIIVFSFYVILIIFIIVRILIRKRLIQKLANFFLIPTSIILIVFTIILAIRIYEQKNHKMAIILVNKVTVMSSPEENGTEVFSLHEGVKVRVQKQSGDWRLIRLSDGKVGWVKQDVLEII